MFAKANLDDDMNVYNIYYDHELFIYPFINQEMPEYIGKVPIVEESPQSTRIDYLDKLFDDYEKKVNRDVEGFIICKDKVSINKYVRRKDGILKPHKE